MQLTHKPWIRLNVVTLKSKKYFSIPEHGDEAPERDKVPLGLVHGSRVWLLTLFWSFTLNLLLRPKPNQRVVLCLIAQSSLTLCNLMDCSPPGSSVHGDSPGKNTRVDCHALLQETFPSQGSNSSLLHCRLILHHLSHQGSPRIPKWVAYPFFKGSFWPWNWTRIFCSSLPPDSWVNIKVMARS